MPPKKFCFTIILLILPLLSINSQIWDANKFVQVSGIITDVSDRPVAGVGVFSKKLNIGTISENSGIYSITSTPGDTIFFRALGFKRYHTIIPSTFDQRHYMVDISLESDTIPIEEIKILPWRSYNEFLKDMTREHPVDPIIANMNDNIASIYVAVANQNGVKISPEAGYRYAMEQNFNAMATKNQMPYNNLLNPFAWSKFINGLKNGLFKNQKYNKPEKARIRKKNKKTQKK